MTNTIFSPSLLACPMLQYQDALSLISTHDQPWLHIDVMDGHFVPNLTFGTPLLEECKKFPKILLDVHLMVTNPDFYLDAWKGHNIHHITFHWEAALHHERLIKKAKELYPSVGVALNPSTPLHVIPDFIFSQLDLILLMSVNPGFYGQSFIGGVLDKITAAATLMESLGAKTMIQVDGGVNEKNIKDLVNRGVKNLVVGASFFKGQGPQDWKKNYQALKNHC